MKHLRYWFITLILWLLVLYNIENFLGQIYPASLAPFVYLLIPIYAIIILLIPFIQRIQIVRLLVTSTIFYLTIKAYLTPVLSDIQILSLVIELVFVWGTIFLCQQIGNFLEQFMEAVTELTIGHVDAVKAVPFDVGQAQIYREIRRARHHHRPATLLSIYLSKQTHSNSFNYFTKKAQEELIDRFITARAANLLHAELSDCDIITQRGDHFVVLLPETDDNDIEAIIHKLKTSAKDNLDIEFEISESIFPKDAVTFEGLLEIAETDYNSSAAKYVAATRELSSNGAIPSHHLNVSKEYVGGLSKGM